MMKHDSAAPAAGALLEHDDRRWPGVAPSLRPRSRYIAAVRQPLPIAHALPRRFTGRFRAGALAAGLLGCCALMVFAISTMVDVQRDEPVSSWSAVTPPLPIPTPSFRAGPMRVALAPVASERIAPVKASAPVARAVVPSPVLSDDASPFAASVVRYQPAQAPTVASEKPSAPAYRIASIASSDLVLIASGEAGAILVTPYHKGDQLPDGRTIVAIDASRSQVVTSGAPIVAGM